MLCVTRGETNRRVSYNPGELLQTLSLGTKLTHTNDHADLGPVGMLIDWQNKSYGTGVLVSDRVVVTAGHVFKYSESDADPVASDWRFILRQRPGGVDHELVEHRYNVSEVHMHAGWTGRLHARGGDGDGDLLGVDIGVAILSEPVTHVQPATLTPDGWLEPLGARVMHAGVGNITNGKTGGERNHRWDTSMLAAGYNTLDRVQQQVHAPHVAPEHTGGVLATDYDDGTQQHNALSASYGTIGYIGTGDSSPDPVRLESTTCAGDSGGPLFVQHDDGDWVLIGINSYGTKAPSVYGDISVYTRVQNHLQWITRFIDQTSNNRIIQPAPEPVESHAEPVEPLSSNWQQLGHLGWVYVMSNGWCYHLTHGWIYIMQTGDHMWVWSDHVGWWWSNIHTYPQIWLHDQQSWSLVDVDRSNTEQTMLYVYRFDQWWIKT